VPVLGIVENMSYFVCPHCGERTDIFRRGAVEAECQKRGVRFLGSVPLVPEVCEGGDLGRPVVAAYPDSPVALAFTEIAAQLAAAISVRNLTQVAAG
jgi:ATP-binding protein involved in chromosome partitioning